MSSKLRVLFCPDLSTLSRETAIIWVPAFLRYLRAENVEVSVLLDSSADDQVIELIQSLDNEIEILIPEPAPEHAEEPTQPRFHARSVIKAASTKEEILYDVVITQGLLLGRYVAGSKTLQPVHWVILDDNPLIRSSTDSIDLKSIGVIARGARLILTTSPTLRSIIESRVPESTSKTRLLPNVPASSLPCTHSGEVVHIIDGLRLLGWEEHDFSNLIAAAQRLKNPPQLIAISTIGPEHNPIENSLQGYPGFKVVDSLNDDLAARPHTFLVPKNVADADFQKLASLARQGDRYTSLDGLVVSLSDLQGDAASEFPHLSNSFQVDFAPDLPDYQWTPVRRRDPVRVVLAGADFKFAGDLVESLVQRNDIELNVDLFAANAKPQPQKSQPFLQSAEVVIAEFAAKNAIWYSQNIRPDQRLIVHLHGYELLQDWITELNIDNCSAIVVASEFYRQKAISMRGWPAEKIRVIPNSVNFNDLNRPKHENARFHIGIVGIVPILKRPDRALDLLEQLLEVDDRFTLHVRGHSPWNYAWEWKKAAHQDAYRQFYRRLGANPALLQHVAFEPFSPDMANWLEGIGWILSPSTRETFHLSAIEGAASGAVPIAWRREGSEEIIGAQFNVDSVEDAAQTILAGRTDHGFSELSSRATNHARKYANEEVRAKWLDLIFDLTSCSVESSSASDSATTVLSEVTNAWTAGDPESAIAVLDEHIQLTKNLRGPLKAAEMFFRGIAASDELRLKHFLPHSGSRSTQSENCIMVRPVGASFDNAEISTAITAYVGVTPPAYLSFIGYIPQSVSSVSLPAPNDLEIRYSDYLRFDRWAEAVKAKIIGIASSYDELAVQGPWWLALPVLQAADQLGIPCAWFIDDDETLHWVDSVNRGEYTTHFAAQIAFSCFEAASGRLVLPNVNLPCNFPISDIEGCTAGNRWGLPVWQPNHTPTSQFGDNASGRKNAPVEFLDPLENYSVGLVSNRSLQKKLNPILNIRELRPKNFGSLLDPTVDAIIVDPSADENGPWKDLLSHSDLESTGTTVQLLDMARRLGTQSCFLWDRHERLPRHLWAVARKCDAIATPNPKNLEAFLELHPSAIRKLVWWDPEINITSRLGLLLRQLSLPVTPLPIETLPTKNVGSQSPLDGDSAELTQFELPPLEIIGVFTSMDQEYWEHQNLPNMLFRVFPLDDFAKREKLDIDYFIVHDELTEIDDDFLLSLWTEADGLRAVLPSHDKSVSSRQFNDFRRNCLYPINTNLDEGLQESRAAF